jgi:hypothetical protein
MSDGERWRRRGEHAEYRQPFPPHHPNAGKHASGETAEPAHAASAEEQIHYRFLAEVLEGPQELRPHHAAENAGDRGVEAAFRQAGTVQLAPQDP